MRKITEGETGSAASSLPFVSLIRDSVLIRHTIPSMHVRILVLICVVSGLGLGLVWGLVHVRCVVFFLMLQMMWMMPALWYCT